MKYLELKEVISACQKRLENTHVSEITQYNSRCFIIHFEVGPEQRNLLISLQTPFVRVHLTHHKGTQVIIPFISQLNKDISSFTLTRLELKHHDRILQADFEKEGSKRTIVAELFSKSPNCYLLDAKGKILHSLFKTPNSTYEPPLTQDLPPPPPLPSPVTSESIEKHYDALESQASFDREKTQIRKIIYRRYKKILRNIDELSKKLDACLKWEQTHHEAELLQANLYQVKKGMSEVIVDDWTSGQKITIQLDPALPPHKQVDNLFQQARKLKKGINHLPKQIDEKEAQRSRLEQELEDLSPIETVDELQKFCEQHGLELPKVGPQNKKEVKPRLPYHRYLSSKGLEILVGKKDKDNDLLTFHHANGNDWWLHVSERPGSHVIIKTHKGADPDPQTLNEACQLAIAHSKAKGEGGAEVVITQQKHLKRKKSGRPGTVFLSKHQKRWVHFDPKLVESLKSKKTS